MIYCSGVDKESETFAERLTRLTAAAKMRDADVASTLGVSENQWKRIKSGTTPSLKLDGALRLCRRLNVSPWHLAGEREPMQQLRAADARLAEFFDESANEVTRISRQPEIDARLQQVEGQASQVLPLLNSVDALNEALLLLVDGIELRPDVRDSVKAKLALTNERR